MELFSSRGAPHWLVQARKLISVAPQNLTVIKAEVNETRQIERNQI